MTNTFAQFQRTQLTVAPQQPPAFGPASRQLPPHMSSAANVSQPPPGPRTCIYCADPAHPIRRCPKADADIATGIIKRNEQFQIVLPSGSYVPSTIPGATLRERVLEYYRQHPEERPANAAAPQLFFSPVSHPSLPTPMQTPSYLASDVSHSTIPPSSGGLIHTLDFDQRIDSLRREIYALERQRAQRRQVTQEAAEHSRSRAERAQRRAVRFDEPDPPVADPPLPSARIEEVSSQADKPSHPSTERSRLEVPSVDVPVTSSASDPPDAVNTIPSDQPHQPTPAALPEHPYRSARDTTYVPPHQRNFAAPPARPPPPPKKQEPSYRTQAPVYDARHAANVFKRCMETQITLSQEELLSIAPDVRQQTRDVCSARRVATGLEPVLAQDVATLELPLLPSDAANDSEELSSTKPVDAFLVSMPASFVQAAQSPPPGSLVVQDPYEVYLRALPPGEDPVPLRVSLESAAVRAIEGVFLNKARVSCILDSGSAIISMSEGVAHSLGIDYDRRIKLPMQCANGEVSTTLGLARNVPVRFGSIVVYLQIHVIADAPYDVLLGRPFDVLTSSSVQTIYDGSQTITLFDPNSDLETTIPTLPRIEPEFSRASSEAAHRQNRPSPGFQAGSRI